MSTRKSSISRDARSLRSCEALRRGLLNLIEVKPYKQISVREIAIAAGVTFPTFYRHYPTKDDLLGEIAAAEIRALLSALAAVVDQRDTLVSAKAVCLFVEGRRTLWRTLLIDEATTPMRDEWLRASYEIVAMRGQINPGYPLELSSSFVFTGILEIISWWLRQPDGYPGHNVAQFIEVLVMRPATIPQKLDLL